MFEYEIAGHTFVFNCRLGTTVKIQKAFKKNITQVLDDLVNMKTVDIIALLHTGIDGDKYTLTEFQDILLDSIGMGELYTMVKLFAYKIQYPDLDFDEIEEKLKEDKLEAEAEKN